MVMFIKLTFKENDTKEKILYQELSRSLKRFKETINRIDFNVYCADRCDECFILGDYDLDDGVFGEIYVEGDDMYKKTVMNRIEGIKNLVNYMI